MPRQHTTFHFFLLMFGVLLRTSLLYGVDCNSNGIDDVIDIGVGTAHDCDSNGVPDECDLASGLSADVNTNGILDLCEDEDCNENGVADILDVVTGTSQDCNHDFLPDECPTTPFLIDTFDTYAPNADIIDLDGGWTGLNANTNAGATVTSVFAHSGSNSLAVAGNTNVVYSFDVPLTETIEISLWQYIPSDHVGGNSVNLFFAYQESGSDSYLTRIFTNSDISTIYLAPVDILWAEPSRLALVADRWVKLRVVISPPRRVVLAYYDGLLVTVAHLTSTFNPSPPRLQFQALNLRAHGSSTVYYDDVSIARINGRDCQPNGIPDSCELASNVELDVNNNGHIDACERVVYVDGYATGADNGSTWADAYAHLQDAFADANAAPTFDEIRIAEGTYQPDSGRGRISGDLESPFIVASDVLLTGGYAGASHVDSDARDTAQYETRLTGDLLGDDDGYSFRDDNTRSVVRVYEKTDRLAIDGVTIIGGGGTTSNFTSGAGISVFGGQTSVTKCVLMDNSAFYGGGAIACRQGSRLVLDRCLLLGNIVTDNPNSAIGGYGGALFLESSGAKITNTVFNYNYGFRGGAIACIGSDDVTISGCTFSNNYMRFLASCLFTESPSIAPTISNSIFWGNEKSAIEGADAPIVRNSIVEGGFAGGTNIIDANPLFVNSNGPDNVAGTMDDNLKLAAGSPAIDSGSNGDVPAGVVTDLDGNPRFNNCAVDMGAFEAALAPAFDTDGDGYTDNCDTCPNTTPGSVVDGAGCPIVRQLENCNIDGVAAATSGFGVCAAGPTTGMVIGCDCVDTDLDGDGDLRDFATLQLILGCGLAGTDTIEAIAQCAGGPGIGANPTTCASLCTFIADRDSDGDIDLADYAEVQRSTTAIR